MKNGFIKTAVASPKIKVADCEYNAGQILCAVKQASKINAKLILFPELVLTGYTCGDLFLQPCLLDNVLEAVECIRTQTKEYRMLIVIGAPLLHNNHLYNCAITLYRGNILGVVPKSHLPNYNEFYEERHFTEASDDLTEIIINGEPYPFGINLLFRAEKMPSFTLGIEICEDLWVPDPPSVSHAKAGATIIANLSASDEVIGKESYRRDLVRGQSARLVCGYLYCGAGEGESTTDMVFAAHSMICENGTMLKESKPFAYQMIVSEIDTELLLTERRRLTTFGKNEKQYRIIEFHLPIDDCDLTRSYPKTPFVPSDAHDREHRCEMILAMQSYGLKKRLEHIGASKPVIGISGGLDSCLALIVAARAMDLLGRERSDIIAVTMPCFGTTQRTKTNAEILCESLGVSFKNIDITDAVRQHFKDIGHDDQTHDVVFENSQARERTQILMDIANQVSGIVIGTGDLSEMALGWSTYNGDHMSMYGVNASVPKTLVRHIVLYAADTAQTQQERDVLMDILDTPVSPELLPAVDGEISQKTEELVGPYELHDFFLYYMIRRAFKPSKIFRIATLAFQGIYEKDTILHWLNVFYRRFFTQQFKRSCTPDAPKVGTVTLSPRADWRMPSDAVVSLWLEDLEQADL